MNIKKQIVQLTKADLDKATKFADLRSNDIALYAKRGGFKHTDLVCGALGELGVYKFLKSKDIRVSKPDLTLHEVKNKTYNADLTDAEGNAFHVKAQTTKSAQLYGRSYLFQKNDPLIRNPSGADYVVPCLVDMDTLTIEIYGIIKAQDVIDGYLGEPKLPHLRNSKVAVYLDTLLEMTPSNRWRL